METLKNLSPVAVAILTLVGKESGVYTPGTAAKTLKLSNRNALVAAKTLSKSGLIDDGPLTGKMKLTALGHEAYKLVLEEQANATEKSAADAKSQGATKAEAASKESPMATATKSRKKPVTVAAKGGKPSKAPGKRATGKTSGLGVQDFWVKMLVENESAKKPLTDPQLTAKSRAEFPGNKSKVHEMVQAIRTKYNKGGFNKGVAPKLKSHRYDEAGEVIDPGTRSAKAAVAKAPKKAATKGTKAIAKSPVVEKARFTLKKKPAAQKPVEAAA